MKLTESGYHEKQCKPGGCRLWRCLQMNPPEDLQAAEGIPWISGAAKAQSHLHTPLPAPGCVQHSTAPSHSLVSQFSLGKSNPREGKIKEFLFFYPFFELEEELSGMPWAKPLSSSCIFLTYALNSIRNPCMLYTNQKPNKAIFLFLWTCRNEIFVRSTSDGSGSGSVSLPRELCGAYGKLHHTSTAQ